MKTNFKWKSEYSITLILLLGLGLFFVPISFPSTIQAQFITKWKDCYNRVVYMKDVINKQESSEILTAFKRANSQEEREEYIISLVKPYFRLNPIKQTNNYRPKYFNKKKVNKNDLYYFKDIYYTDKKVIVGIKDIDETEDSMFMMMFDINGKLPPNIWGKDIYGAKIYDDRIEAFGQSLQIDDMRKDCSSEGTGISCSYYYKIGGNFVE